MDGGSSQIRGNTLLFDGSNSYAMEFWNNNYSNVYRNTIISNPPDRSGESFVVTGGASPVFNSNLIYGFGTLLRADSDVYTLKFNLGMK